MSPHCLVIISYYYFRFWFIAVLKVSVWGKLSAVADRHSFFRAVGSWEFRLSALMVSHLAWANGKSGRQAEAMLTLYSAL